MINSIKTPSETEIGCIYLIKTHESIQLDKEVYTLHLSHTTSYQLPTGSMLMFHLACQNCGDILKRIQDVFETKYIVISINEYEGDYTKMMTDMFQVFVIQTQISTPSTTCTPCTPCTPCVPTCVNCNKTFKNKYNLKNHLPRCKGVRRRFTCDYCFRQFNHANNKYPHMRVCKKRPQPITTDRTASTLPLHL